jgi:GTP cyclohydrolase II
MFRALGFERDILNGVHRVETALALVLGDVTAGVPLVRIHSQCFTGEMLGSLRCDCRDQLEMAMQAIAEEGRGLLIYEPRSVIGGRCCFVEETAVVRDASAARPSLCSPCG